MHNIPRLDLMIAYSCNIKCTGCISLSDFKRDGIASYIDIVQWVDQWKSILNPATLVLFGGEPCLHPKLIDICDYIHSVWPDATLRLITNGYLLDRFNTMDWFKYPKFEMQISIHRKDHETHINRELKKILLQRKNWKVHTHGGDHHKQISWTSPGFTIYKSIFKDFIVPYRTENNTVTFWNSNPVAAHKICGAPDSPVLYKGVLYKCPPVANIFDITKNLFSNYKGYTADDDISEFVNNIGKPESVCGQCPDSTNAVIIDHFDKRNVIVKQKITS